MREHVVSNLYNKTPKVLFPIFYKPKIKQSAILSRSLFGDIWKSGLMHEYLCSLYDYIYVFNGISKI
jgi:hypothetical protein